MEAMIHYGYLQRKETIEVIEKICIEKEPAKPVVCARWIDVNQLVPPIDEEVIVAQNSELGYLYYVSYRNEDNSWGGCSKDKGIEFWMPLPEQPKDGDNE